MRQILEIDRVVSPRSRFIGKDSLGKYHTINTDRDLHKGQSVLLVNGNVVGTVETTIDRIFEV